MYYKFSVLANYLLLEALFSPCWIARMRDMYHDMFVQVLKKQYLCGVMSVFHFGDTMLLRVVACVLLCMCVSVCVDAEVITLRSGQVLSGEVVWQNDEVLVIQSKNGSRYQYPLSEVVSIEAEQLQESVPASEAETAVSVKKVALRVEMAGGSCHIPQAGWGGYTSGDLLVGTYDLMHRSVFVGGGLGVHAMFVGSEVYTFLPLELSARVPCLPSLHSPVVGVTLGYGFALGSKVKGGIHTGLDVGWQYRFHTTSRVSVCADVQWQQSEMQVVEMVGGKAYSKQSGLSMLSMGLKVGIQF